MPKELKIWKEKGIAEMKEECLICKAPLEYLEEGIMMECAVCHKKEMSRTRCINGHYVCNECHTRGIDTVISFCLEQDSKNPYEILEGLMELPFLSYARPGTPYSGWFKPAHRI